MKIVTRLLYVILPSIFFFQANAANLIGECNGCTPSQTRQQAIQLGTQLIRGGNVYILNFTGHQLSKFYTWTGDVNDPRSSYDHQVEILRKQGVSEKEIISYFNGAEFGSNRLNTTHAIEIVTTDQERQIFSDLDAGLDYLRERITGQIHSGETHPFTGQMVGNEFSGYDVIGDRSLAVALLRDISADSTSSTVLTIAQAVEKITSVFEAINLNYTLEVTIRFPDGSKGIAVYRDGDLVFDDTRFIDKNGNSIPLSRSNTVGRTYRFASTNARDFRQFFDRLVLLGVPITNGDTTGYTCSWSCGADGCTLSCSTH